eukprot:CAMPEP_0174968140 /NCGR_PEP_ID=MMETSP0004_2-20121128/7962_1 /TAXON_ID=420556 /ORGANISM="Ochromonas sp., Strain CCMP1393" /LENGTH=359 /DNA_ID=CAMNT_0016217327 /DNA_START=21 /DNA_END=1100 /DNA_ORIENTATION=+
MADSKQDAIKRQIEFYFSDSNFRKDKFLQTKAKEDPNGYVKIETLLTFNRLKSLTTDVAVILDSIKESSSVEVSDDGLGIKRSTELPELDDSMDRTLYVKGFPVDDADVTIEAISEQFSAYGKVCMVRLRKNKPDKTFKGSCFVEYDDKKCVETAIAAAHEGEEVKIGYKGSMFNCVMAYTEWQKRKEMKLLRHNKAPGSGSKRKAEGDAAADATGESGDAVDTATADAPTKVEFTPGLIFRVGNVPDDATLYELKDHFKTITAIKFVDHETGKKEAYVRTADEESSTKLKAALEAGTCLRTDTEKFTYTLLAGEEEVQYWEKIAANSKGGGGGGGRGGGGRGRGGRGGRGGGFKKRRY